MAMAAVWGRKPRPVDERGETQDVLEVERHEEPHREHGPAREQHGEVRRRECPRAKQPERARAAHGTTLVSITTKTAMQTTAMTSGTSVAVDVHAWVFVPATAYTRADEPAGDENGPGHVERGAFALGAGLDQHHPGRHEGGGGDRGR